MDKYDIENGIDFFSELYKSLDDDSDEYADDINACLITSQPLSDFFVTMKCGHKFNYNPLYFDIKNHKQKFNSLESVSGRLNQNELRCPYCRKKQVGVLPYHEELGLPKVHGINYIDPEFKSSSVTHAWAQCEFLTPNECFDPSGNEIVETSSDISVNCKFYSCTCVGSQIKKYNLEISSGGAVNHEDEKKYCWFHKKVVLRKRKQAKIAKDKEEAKLAKLKIKDDLKHLKEAEKQQAKAIKEQAKAEKEQAKAEKQQAKAEKAAKKLVKAVNIVLGPSEVSNENDNNIVGCVEILKAGPNKGCACGCKVLFNNLCRRHLNIQMNIQTETL